MHPAVSTLLGFVLLSLAAGLPGGDLFTAPAPYPAEPVAAVAGRETPKQTAPSRPKQRKPKPDKSPMILFTVR